MGAAFIFVYMSLKNIAKLIVLTVAAATTIAASAQDNVTMNITHLRSDKGYVIVQVFNTQQGFKDSKPIAKFKYAKKDAVKGSLTVKCSLKPGTYGLALLDDENANGKMDNNMVGMPKEGFGFSDYYHTGMSRPVLDDFKFEVKDAPVRTTMKVRYL